jgi:hypothetical protein
MLTLVLMALGDALMGAPMRARSVCRATRRANWRSPRCSQTRIRSLKSQGWRFSAISL